jgi:EAL domain-containing protein (putative c-di-GMP-specific phosphodiesterase class I)
LLQRLGCPLVQGFLIGRPMAADALERLLLAEPAAAAHLQGQRVDALPI